MHRVLALLLATFALSAPASAQTLTVSGTCPGSMSIIASGFASRTQLALLSSSGEGTAALPAGPCAGTATELASSGLALRARLAADSGGNMFLLRDIPAGACGATIQVVDVASCGVMSNTATLAAPVPQDTSVLTCDDRENLPTADITGTEGLAMGPDGTLYYSQSGAVGRRQPYGGAEDGWVTLPVSGTVWGLALQDDGSLYVVSPSGGGRLYRIDTTVSSPVAQTVLTGLGSPNGLIAHPSGFVVYSDFSSGHVFRVTPSGVRQQVTSSPIANANGLLLDDDGTLLVLSYATGQIWRLLVNASFQEVGRSVAGSIPGSPDGIARDDLGRYYVSDNGGGRLFQLDASMSNPTVVRSGIPAAANIVFGQGAVSCHDVYVASGGVLGRFASDAPGRP